MLLEFFIAGRYLRSRRKQSFISLIGILSVFGVALGVMALVVVISVMSGAETDFRKRILGLEPHILVMGRAKGIEDHKLLSDEIGQIPGVIDSSPFIYGKVILRSSRGMSGAFLRGIDTLSPKVAVESLTREELLSYLKEDEASLSPGIILGKNLASELGVLPGDTIQLMSPEFMISPIGLMPKVRKFRVGGLFSSGLYEYDGALCYLEIKEAARIMGMDKRVTGIGVWLDDVYKAENLGNVIKEKMGPPYWVRNWMDMNKNLFSALKLEKAAMFVILTLIVLVAAFNIASSLIMLVMEKTKDISILMAMGAKKRLIRRIFVIQGMIIGFMGTFAGIVLGVLLCLFLERYPIISLPDAYPFTTLPIRMEWTNVFFIALSSLLICFFSTLYPASQASRLDPVEGVRYG